MIAVVVSREDEASLSIRDALLEAEDWERCEASSGSWEREWQLNRPSEGFVMVEKEGLHLYYDGLDSDLKEVFEISLVVFVSRHSGDTGPLLTAHHTGNFGSADYGGEPNSLSTPAPAATRHLVRFFEDNTPGGFEPSLEATHHGPSEIETPSVFAEVGSRPEEWERDDAAMTVAEGVLSLPERDKPRTRLIGLGGGHYAPRFTRVVLETDAGFGHIVADYGLEAVEKNPKLLEDAFESSDADAVLLCGDYEGEEVPYPVVSESYLRERAGVPEKALEAVEEAIGAEPGEARLTNRAQRGASDGVGFNAEIVRETANTDREATYEALEETALGYTEKDGQVAGVCVAPGEVESLAGDLAEVLRSAYDVELKDDGMVLEKEVFDPKKAKELGVKEGPDFGRLSSGETIRVDGREVHPEDVHRNERRSMPYSGEGEDS